MENLDDPKATKYRKCWFTKNGTLMQTDEMRRIVETKTFDNQHDEPLNTVLKFEQCGIRVDKVSTVFYEPSILTHCMNRRIACLVVCDTLVDDRLALALSRCEFDRIDFYECTITAGMIHAKEHIKYEKCLVFGTYNTCTVHNPRINGYLTYSGRKHHIQFDGMPGRDTIDAEEQTEYMQLCVQFLAELPATGRAYDLADSVDVRMKKTSAYYVAMSKYKSIFTSYYRYYFDYMGPDDPMEELCAGLSGAKVTIPVEWLTEMDMLIALSYQGLVKPRHPFFAQRFSVSSIAHLDVRVLEPRNDIASFVSGLVPWARECPLYPIERDRDYLQMHIPLDQIDDALESEGFTVEMMDMLIDQISVFHGRSSALR
jgi:hypothetical protein